MTVANTTRKIQADGDGAQTAFTFPFKIFSETDLEISKVTKATGATSLQVITTDYTVVIDPVNEGGTVTYVVAPTALEASLIVREIAVTQPTNIPSVGNLREEQLENEYDRSRMIDQQLQEQIDRCIQVAITETAAPGFPVAAADKIIGWDSTGTNLINVDQDVTVTDADYAASITFGLDAAKAAAPVLGDIFYATDTEREYFCWVAGTWSTRRVYEGQVNWAQGADIASATTTDIGAATGNFIDVTGTVTITGLGTVQAGTLRLVTFTGILILTHNATSLILPGAANITTAAGDTAIFVSLGSGNWRAISFSKAAGTPIVAGAVPDGSVVQVVNTQDGAVATGTTTLPNDDTIPQNTEGDEYMTLAITPASTTNKLLITVTIVLNHSAVEQLAAALFQDTTVNALKAVQGSAQATDKLAVLTFSHFMTAGTVAATTFKVRAGSSVAGTTTFNGDGTRLYGGVMGSSITITEIQAS